MNEKETIADIAAEIRRGERMFWSMKDCSAFADRIEAAAEREIAERGHREYDHGYATGVRHGREDAGYAPGNAAAMREALENARSKFIHIKKCADEGEVSRKKLTILCEFVSQEIAAALAAPARNCDVGTAQEQAERHGRFCAAHYKADAVDAQCFGCPASDKKETDCEFVWGQLPFAPAEGGSE